jgi:hypothetical protein
MKVHSWKEMTSYPWTQLTIEMSVSNADLHSLHLLSGNNLKASFLQSACYLNSQNGSLKIHKYLHDVIHTTLLSKRSTKPKGTMYKIWGFHYSNDLYCGLQGAVYFSKISVPILQTTWGHKPGDQNIHGVQSKRNYLKNICIRTFITIRNLLCLH